MGSSGRPSVIEASAEPPPSHREGSIAIPAGAIRCLERPGTYKNGIMQELSQRLQEYESLLEIGVELASSLDLTEVLETALEKAEVLCRAETSSIWELDEATGELFFRVVRGTAASAIRDHRVRVGVGIVGSVADSARGEIVNDVDDDPRWRGDFDGGFRTRAILAVPLLARGRLTGVLQLLNPVGRDGFALDDLERMRLFAAPLGQAIENARLYAALELRFHDTVTALAEAVEKRDPYTAGHVQRVVYYAVMLGAELGWDRESLDRLRISATLHDIGKIGVPDRVLGKDGPLDDEEASLMRRHPVDGAEIVGRIGELRGVLGGVRSHHERLDGRGYPDGLLDGQIPGEARVIAVADTFDAMTTDRPYRRALTAADAAAEIRAGTGTQFCPEVAAAFERLMLRGAFTVESGRRLIARLFGEVPQG